MKNRVAVIGAGLAGCESAWFLSKNGFQVDLYEMKPKTFSPAHSYDGFAELVCSNSLKSMEITNANGLLKAELSMLDSIVLWASKKAKVSAGSALAVERSVFSDLITERIKSQPNINVITKEVDSLDFDCPVIVTTGPLSSPKLNDSLAKLCGQFLYFYDASSPIVTRESLDFNSCFFGSRYGKGGDDYINCPLNREQYEQFVSQLVLAETVILKDFERNVFEGCMPIEAMARRGFDSLRFGMMKPVGFTDPTTDRRPYALVQLRREDEEGRLFNLVGFQTNLKFKEQQRVFSLIPALKDAEFTRYGVMHKNTFINAPKLLNSDFSFKSNSNIFVGGQLSGVEGYIESSASGLFCAIYLALRSKNSFIAPPKETMLGALFNQLFSKASTDFQPITASFGLLPYDNQAKKDKKLKKQIQSERALSKMTEYTQQIRQIITVAD